MSVLCNKYINIAYECRTTATFMYTVAIEKDTTFWIASLDALTN